MSNYSVKPERQHRSREVSQPHWDVHVKDPTVVENSKTAHSTHNNTLETFHATPTNRAGHAEHFAIGMQNTQQYRGGHAKHTYSAEHAEHTSMPHRAYTTLSNTMQGIANTQQYHAGHTQHSAITVLGMQNTQQ